MKFFFSKKFLLVVVVLLLFIPLHINTSNAKEDLFESAKLVPSSGAEGRWYGYAVGISGDTAVTLATATDVAYVFEKQLDEVWDGENLALSQYLPYIGAVAVSGNTVAIGDPVNSLVYVFTKLPNGWSRNELTGPPATMFGWSVAIDGHTLVVGSLLDGGGVGAARIFNRD